MGSSSPVTQSCAAIGGSQVPVDEKEPQEDKECDNCKKKGHRSEDCLVTSARKDKMPTSVLVETDEVLFVR